MPKSNKGSAISNQRPATLGYKNKPLGEWPDQEKHEATQTPEEEGEQSDSGSMSNPEEIEDEDVLERAKKAGLYSQYSDDAQGEVGLGEEEEEDIEEEKQT